MIFLSTQPSWSNGCELAAVFSLEQQKLKEGFGDKTERDGRTYYWFPHHKFSGFSDGHADGQDAMVVSDDDYEDKCDSDDGFYRNYEW